ncbi:hypothetical protein [Pontivivens ytuae]|uniref:Uncharacterized protein n=1 Tax=Pontivivens ytuae TaxID=2789856 RepID=A0A7S9LRW1_9RHOB|nr:hypothetical protein [Pontivivens ytuae]QPH54164.1 hypothetical protein I0K15_20740 [Pontivivens ytuae]
MSAIAVAHFPSADGYARPPLPTPESWLAVLPMLRLAALRCRAHRRIDPWQACSFLSPATPLESYVDGVLLLLEDGLGRRPVFHAPAAAENSFDESWLLRLLERQIAGDAASVEMLLRSRIRPAELRRMGFLLRGLAERLAALQ